MNKYQLQEWKHFSWYPVHLEFQYWMTNPVQWKMLLTSLCLIGVVLWYCILLFCCLYAVILLQSCYILMFLCLTIIFYCHFAVALLPAMCNKLKWRDVIIAERDGCLYFEIGSTSFSGLITWICSIFCVLCRCRWRMWCNKYLGYIGRECGE